MGPRSREQRREYAERVYASVEYIEENLGKRLDLDSICREAGVSKYYFTRIFQATVGETVFDYLRRRRISEIAHRLVHTDEPIVDLALSYGYDSQQSMTKAFTRQYGTTPGQYRKGGEERFFNRRPPITRRRILDLTENLSMTAASVELPTLLLVGIRERMPISHGGLVEETRRRFFAFAPRLVNRRRHRGFFEVTIMDGRQRQRFADDDYFEGFIGYSMKEPPDSMSGLETLELPASSYLTFHYRGDSAIGSLSRLYGHVFSTGLLHRREELKEAPFFHYYPSDQTPGRRERASLRFFLPICAR